MNASYATLLDVKTRMAGDKPNMGPNYDQTLVDKIGEVSSDIDREMSKGRGIIGPWSFLADSESTIQLISLSGTPTGGTLLLTFDSQTTGQLAVDSAASVIKTALEGLSSIGAGNVDVSGAPGGPWRVTFQGDLLGPQDLIIANGSGVLPTTSLVAVQELVRGVLAVPSTRTFRVVAAPWDTVFIDDCVEITAVTMAERPDLPATTLTLMANYVTNPASGTPIVGLQRVNGRWPQGSLINVTARWGYGLSIPRDVREATIIEVIRSYLGDRAGNNDQVGMTPWGTMVTAKAFTHKTWQMINAYCIGAGALRR